MKKARNTRARDPEMLPEYDFRGGVRGKYAKRFAKGSNVVVIDPDVARHFPTSESVNAALRAAVELRRAMSANGGSRRKAG